MKLTPKLREEIIRRMQEMKLSHLNVSNKAGTTDTNKPYISKQTISNIVRGKQQTLGDEAFSKLAEVLNLDKTLYLKNPLMLRIAFDPSCYAAPIITSLVNDNGKEKELDNEKLLFSCYEEDGVPVIQSTYNQTPPIDQAFIQKENQVIQAASDEHQDDSQTEKHVIQPESDEHQENSQKEVRIFTPNETLGLLRDGKIDIAFLPVLTAEETPGIIRIARCMNTVKGGLYLFVIEKKASARTLTPLETDFFDKSKEFRYDLFKPIRDIITQKDELSQEDKRVIVNKMLQEGYTQAYINEVTNQGELEDNRCCFCFPQNSIAEVITERKLFAHTSYKKHPIEVKNIPNFQEDIMKRVKKFFEDFPEAKYFIVVGWDVLIDRLYTLFTNHIYTDDDDQKYAGRYILVY